MREEVVYIIIVNWNGWKDTVECLDSLKKLSYKNIQIVVVDNGSTDASIEKLQRFIKDIKLISLAKNLGFSHANNIGIRLAMKNKAKYILLLNNDTIVDPDLINVFVDTMNKYSQAGALAAKVYYYGKKDVLWFAGSFVDREGEFPTHIGLGEKDQGQYDEIKDTPFINGSAFFAKVAAIKKVGLLDERYFYMYEDGDWSIRFIKAKYHCLFVPQAKIWHKIHQATGGRTPHWWYFDARNRLLWTKLNFPHKSLFQTAKPYILSIFEDFKNPIISKHPKYWLNLWKNGVTNWISKMIGIFDYFRGYYGDYPKFLP